MAFAEWIKNDLDLGDLISGSFKIVKLRLSHFLLVVVLVEFTGSILSSHFFDKAENLDPYLTIAASFLITFLFSVLENTMLILIVDGFSTGRTLSFAEMLLRGIKLFPLVILSSLITGLIVLLGMALLIIPGILVAVYVAFFQNAIVLRKKGPIDALRYSYELVKGRWWLVFGVLALVFIVVLVLSVTLELISMKIDLMFVPQLFQSLLNGFFSVLLCVFFLNLETREQN